MMSNITSIKKQVLDESEKFFVVKGFNKTTIQDILNSVGIAKGTFYYYFKSKDDVLNCIIDRRLDICVNKMKTIMHDKKLTPQEKLYWGINTQKIFFQTEGKIKDQLHLVENAQFHQRSFVQSVKKLTPILTKIIQEGIDDSSFSTPFPQSTAELLLSASLIFDNGLFQWSEKEKQKKVLGYIYIVEKSLGVPRESLANLKKLFDC
ncbi:TetR/AcrR family transcriptional regulator [Lactobacillus sp. UCMA15818]|uniref:TetR/AcrR family transcriptional regulator n=1 Tax=Lactobacillus sp. UCMA15818 TaxID=2583394 RepID=UPI0025B21582|nr:TetR/AcrR family transcriptional regulator [Lactobacillus sp. UCMA15818]